MEKGALDDAIADYDEVIRLDPKHGLAHANRGTAHAKRGEYDKAAADFKQAVRLQERLVNDFPDVPKYREMLAYSLKFFGFVSRYRGRPEEAVAAFRSALELRESLVYDFPADAAYWRAL